MESTRLWHSALELDQVTKQRAGLLVAMPLIEAAFGLLGLLAGPIQYAYLKNELEAERLI